MALNSDVGSTLIDLAGLPVPEAHTGRSFASLMRGDETSGWRKDFLCEFLAVPGTIPRWEGVRGEGMTYARYFVNGPEKPPYEFLFDLKNDPKQLTNLVDGNSEHPFLGRMRNRCDQLAAMAGHRKEIGETSREPPKKRQKPPAKAPQK
jgi:arylsulfatase A-like enzyme